MKWNCRPIKLNGEKKMRECEYMCLYGACVWVWVSVDSIPYATFKKKNPICLKAGQAEDRSIFLSPTIHISPVHILDSVELFFPLTFALFLSLSLFHAFMRDLRKYEHTAHFFSIFFCQLLLASSMTHGHFPNVYAWYNSSNNDSEHGFNAAHSHVGNEITFRFRKCI